MTSNMTKAACRGGPGKQGGQANPAVSGSGTEFRNAGRPSRQALFPVPDSCVVSADALWQAERILEGLGFAVVSEHQGVWRISRPGSALKIWRYSAAELCHFAYNQATRYPYGQSGHYGTRRGSHRLESSQGTT